MHITLLPVSFMFIATSSFLYMRAKETKEEQKLYEQAKDQEFVCTSIGHEQNRHGDKGMYDHYYAYYKPTNPKYQTIEETRIPISKKEYTNYTSLVGSTCKGRVIKTEMGYKGCVRPPNELSLLPSIILLFIGIVTSISAFT